jgi:hypothetical protein
MDRKPLVLIDGKITQFDSSVDNLAGDRFSGDTDIASSVTLTIPALKQMINFTELILDGDLNLEGDLWLA